MVTTMSRSRKTYTELSKLTTFEERFEYCKCGGGIGVPTFGGSRYLNQKFYSSPEWMEARDAVILRDNGCDLGCLERPVYSSRDLIIHHLNPITKEQVLNRDRCLFDPENLISCSRDTHNRIHYSNSCPESRDPITRTPNDTCPWKGNSNGR